MEANTQASVELIENINDKVVLTEQSLSKVREQVSVRFQALQKQLIETLSSGTATADFNLSF